MEQLREYPLTLRTPVWHQGLPQWVQAKDVAEIRYIIEQKAREQQLPFGQPYVRQEPYVGQQPPYGTPSQTPAQNTMPNPAAQTPYRQQPIMGGRPVNRTIKTDDRPSSYLGWAIAATLLCCLLPGVVAIIYAAGVNGKYNRGDIEGARKASERAQMWIIITVVAGLLWMPFYTLFQLLLQM